MFALIEALHVSIYYYDVLVDGLFRTYTSTIHTIYCLASACPGKSHIPCILVLSESV